MTDQLFPIAPPPELVRQWLENGPKNDGLGIAGYIATQAARWGSDQELEACCEWLVGDRLSVTVSRLRAARRPRPLSLRELALASVKRLEESGGFFSDQMRELAFIRKALEQFND